MKNYATWNPEDKNANIILSNGNLTATASGTANKSVRSTLGVSTGKHYWEIDIDVGATHHQVGIGDSSATLNDFFTASATGWGYCDDGNKRNNAVAEAYGLSFGDGHIISIALDMDNGKIWFAYDGSWQDNGDPVAGTNPAYTGLTGTLHAMYGVYYDSYACTANFGASAFQYSVPTGFKSGLYTLVDDDIDINLSTIDIIGKMVQGDLEPGKILTLNKHTLPIQGMDISIQEVASIEALKIDGFAPGIFFE